MSGLDLKDLARRGAIARLAELEAESAAILKEFPELRKIGRAGVAYTDDGTTILPGRTSRRRGRRPMSAAQRKAVSVRMRKYWAAQRRTKHPKRT
jgi:hypothetical protein